MSGDVPLCVIAAHPMEFPQEVSLHLGKKIPSLVEYEGMLWGVTGVGKRNVIRFYRLLDNSERRIRGIFLVGFAGALDKSLKRGDCVTFEAVLDESRHKYELTVLPSLKRVVGLEVGHWTNKSEKAKLREQFVEACVIDMETATHAKESQKRGIPLVVLRVISDEEKDKLPSIPYIAEDFSRLPWKWLWFHPIHFFEGFVFSWRLWQYRQKLAKQIWYWRWKVHASLENT